MPRPDAAMPAPGFLHDHPNFVDLLRQLASARGEERVSASFQPPEQPGIFSRIKDAFSGGR